MFLKKVLNQPQVVGTVMIALMVCAGFVYAFAFDGFNVETATGGEVESWFAGTTPEICKPNGNEICEIRDKYGNNPRACHQQCGNMRQGKRCKYRGCGNKK